MHLAVCGGSSEALGPFLVTAGWRMSRSLISDNTYLRVFGNLLLQDITAGSRVCVGRAAGSSKSFKSRRVRTRRRLLPSSPESLNHEQCAYVHV